MEEHHPVCFVDEDRGAMYVTARALLISALTSSESYRQHGF